MADSIVVPALDAEQSCVSYVYLISHPDGTPCYVGKGKGGRLRDHLTRSHNQDLARLVAESKERFSARKICDGLSEKKAYELERFLILEIGRKANGGPLLNRTDGGDGATGRKMSDEERAMRRAAMANPETRARMRLARLGKPLCRTPEGRERHRASVLGNRFGVGRKNSKEHRLKLSVANRDKKVSPETRAKIRATRIGKTISDSQRAQIAVTLRAAYLRDPAILERQKAGRRARRLDPENRQKVVAGRLKQAEAMRRVWKERKAHGSTVGRQSLAHRERLSATMRAAYLNDPSMRQRLAEGHRKYLKNESNRAALVSASRAAYLSDPGTKERLAEGRRKWHEKQRAAKRNGGAQHNRRRD